MIAAPAHWNQVAVRGCAICVHGRRADGTRCRGDGDAALCIHPEVAGQLQAISVVTARKHGGPCGIEALRLAFPGIPA